jgi:hypothetical protein
MISINTVVQWRCHFSRRQWTDWSVDIGFLFLQVPSLSAEQMSG